MLDERWSDDVEEIGQALRKILQALSTPERVRAAEAREDGRDPELENALSEFGLDELTADAELFARIAWELGNALAPVAYVEAIPALAVLGRPGTGLSREGMVPAALPQVATCDTGGVRVGAVVGKMRRTAAGDWLVAHEPVENELLGDAAVASRLERFAALVEAARLVGAGQALLHYGIAYAAERQQFGRVIGTYQAVAHRLARASGELDAAELLVRKAAFSAREEAGGDGAPSQVFAWMVRAKAIEATLSAATHVHQVFGGNGFTTEYDVQIFSRRIRSWAMRGPRASADLAALGRMLLEPTQRDQTRLLWHYDAGMPLPGWAWEADRSWA